MSKEPTRPKARLPRGFSDARAEDIRARDEMLAAIKEVYELYGFEPLETPAFEFTEALGKFLPDVDRPEGGVFSLQDDDEQWLSLRYDLTAPLARFVAENFDALPKPFRRYQLGPVWRNEKPGPGRYRQFYQFDVDTVGTRAMAADAELAMVLCDALESLGIPLGRYRVRINNRNILNGVLQELALFSPIPSINSEALIVERRLRVLRSMDKLDRIGLDGVCQLLGPGRKDESGDFTAGAGLDDGQIDRVIRFLRSSVENRAGVLSQLSPLVGDSNIGIGGIEELKTIDQVLTGAGYLEDRVVFDPSVVRGLAYYTGPVIEAELLDEITNEDGQRVQIGSVAGGGRYDDLVARFTGNQVPATGVSIGVSRLLAALKALKGEAVTARGPVVVLMFDNETSVQQMTAELRRAGIKADLYLGGSGMRAQLKYADKRRSPIAVIEGEDERAKGEVTLKDLILGAEMARTVADNKTWREDQPAQVSVKRSDLVSEVRAMLARQGARR